MKEMQCCGCKKVLTENEFISRLGLIQAINRDSKVYQCDSCKKYVGTMIPVLPFSYTITKIFSEEEVVQLLEIALIEGQYVTEP
jgi:hypothetical protein